MNNMHALLKKKNSVNWTIFSLEHKGISLKHKKISLWVTNSYQKIPNIPKSKVETTWNPLI